MDKRFFTVQEANELIPFLTGRLRELREAYTELKDTSEKTAPSLQEVVMSGGMPVHNRYYCLVSRVQTVASEIGDQGCHVKDLETGLVDFPTIWEGREVFLCWKLGENEVGHWHEIDAGFAGRQPLKGEP